MFPEDCQFLYYVFPYKTRSQLADSNPIHRTMHPDVHKRREFAMKPAVDKRVPST